jgi:hypothetical protein
MPYSKLIYKGVDDMEQRTRKMQTQKGFIAALDQSGGSTAKALKLYGVNETAYSNDEEMFDLMHAMRARIMTSPEFNSNYILGAILFESTLDRQVDGKSTAAYLCAKNILPFLKVDKGLADIEGDVQLMKPIPGLDSLLMHISVAAYSSGGMSQYFRMVFRLTRINRAACRILKPFSFNACISLYICHPFISRSHLPTSFYHSVGCGFSRGGSIRGQFWFTSLGRFRLSLFYRLQSHLSNSNTIVFPS